METLGDIRQAYQDAGRGSSREGSSLPSMRDHSRRWSHIDPAPSCGLLSPRTSCVPVPPRHRQRTKSVVAASQSLPGLLSVAEPSQLSQSAPSIMEPLLSSDIMTQARAHIQIRLGSHNAVNDQKCPQGLLSALHPRTPKLLAPLNRRPRNSAALPVVRHHVPLKPISQSPLSSGTSLRRERPSWGSPLTTKGGSEESGSSSSSSTQSSMDLEDDDEEDERDIKERSSEDRLLRHLKDVNTTKADLIRKTKLHFNIESKIGHLPPIHRSAHNLGRDESDLLCIADRHSVMKCDFAKQDDSINYIKGSVNEITSGSKDENHSVGCTKEPDSAIIHGITANDKDGLHHLRQTEKAMKDSCSQESQVHEQILRNAEDAKLKPCTDVGKTYLLISAVHVDPRRDEKTLKPAQNSERRTGMNCELRANNQTNQSFNILAHKDQGIMSQCKSKSRLTHVKEKSTKSPETIISSKAVTVTKVKAKLKSVGAHCYTGKPSPRKKVIDHPQNKRTNPEKLSSNRAQQYTPVRELNSARTLKKVTVAGAPRSKSVVDFVTYKDMFQQIQNEDEGPAIYEMFAGPVYDNLRVSSTCVKTDRQVQSSLSRKPRQSHRAKHRPSKQPHCKLRKSPRETMVVLPKNKAKLVSPRAKAHLTAVPRKGTSKTDNMPKLEVELVLSEHEKIYHNDAEEKAEDHILSTIEEALSKYGSETLQPDDKTLTGPITSPHAALEQDYSHMHVNKQETSVNSSRGNLNGAVPEHVLHQNQLKINTWTSSSSSTKSNAIVSPVYQKFLDEVGDGPLTDDLLQCLAEELISLDERDVTIGPCSDNLKPSKKTPSREEGPGRDILSEVDSTDSAAMIGSLVADDTITWTKGEVLGRGAYGTVYCGLTSQGQLVAVKQVCLDTSDPGAAKREYTRLQEEVELLKTLRHSNIVGFLGTSLYQHVVSIFMEYIPGGSIASILHRFGPLPERVLALYTHQIVKGVAYLHLNRVIHRDLKGNNVMLMPNGIIKLIDFGCARRLSCLNHTASNSGDLLKSVHGTPYWMAPEVISEAGYGRKSDIWSIGCTVFEMATGKPPLAHMDKMAAMFYIGAQRGLMPSLPERFSDNAKDFVKSCLTSDQRLRPSADQLLKHSFISKTESAANSWETQKKTCCGHSGLCG
uniref:Mitogen-activated protein kinase kinase kinase 19 n=1 Tax=Anabas testudineus TaxID=64144 RepID=A0A3Q1IHL9_ANATE